MKKFIGVIRYLSLAPVLTLLLTFALAIYVGVLKSVQLWITVLSGAGKPATTMLHLIQIVDVFLVAIVLYMLATSIYNMFVGDPGISPKLVAHNLSELKSKLGGIIVLVLTVRFAEVMFEATAPALEILWLALATTAISAVLIAFSWFGHSEESVKA